MVTSLYSRIVLICSAHAYELGVYKSKQNPGTSPSWPKSGVLLQQHLQERNGAGAKTGSASGVGAGHRVIMENINFRASHPGSPGSCYTNSLSMSLSLHPGSRKPEN